MQLQPIYLFLLFVGSIALTINGFIIGRLIGENKLLKHQRPAESGRLSWSEIAALEDALAVLTDVRIRQEIERKRAEAVDDYSRQRLDGLASILGTIRNGSPYEVDQPADRPEDY